MIDRIEDPAGTFIHSDLMEYNTKTNFHHFRNGIILYLAGGDCAAKINTGPLSDGIGMPHATCKRMISVLDTHISEDLEGQLTAESNNRQAPRLRRNAAESTSLPPRTNRVPTRDFV